VARRGVIEEYRDRMPVTDDTPVVTLREGGTPLIHSEQLSELTGCEVHLKYDGANPTGSFKDRGMTLAISKAKEAGRAGGHLRVDRQHLGVGRRVRGKGRG
jgi:threonine synthase